MMDLHHRSLGSMTIKETRATKLKALAADADALAGAARKVEQAATQALGEGTPANLQPQMAFMTGALARILKDWGAIEYLQGWKRDR